MTSNLDDQGEPTVGTYWQHKKGGMYRILMCGYLEKTMERVVAYQKYAYTDIFVRPMGEFLDGRFKAVDNDTAHTIRNTQEVK